MQVCRQVCRQACRQLPAVKTRWNSTVTSGTDRARRPAQRAKTINLSKHDISAAQSINQSINQPINLSDRRPNISLCCWRGGRSARSVSLPRRLAVQACRQASRGVQAGLQEHLQACLQGRLAGQPAGLQACSAGLQRRLAVQACSAGLQAGLQA